MSSKTRIGILSSAHLHAESYAGILAGSPEIEFVGIADADAGRGREMARRFDTAYFADADTLLEQELAGAIVTSENIFHRSLVEKAADAGVPAILCEKPLATT